MTERAQASAAFTLVREVGREIVGKGSYLERWSTATRVNGVQLDPLKFVIGKDRDELPGLEFGPGGAAGHVFESHRGRQCHAFAGRLRSVRMTPTRSKHMSQHTFRRFFTGLAVALVLCPLPRTSRSATLTLGQDAHSYFPNLFSLDGAGVSASDGSVPIAAIPYSPQWPSIPASGGSMSLDYVGAGDQVQVRFSVSLF